MIAVSAIVVHAERVLAGLEPLEYGHRDPACSAASCGGPRSGPRYALLVCRWRPARRGRLVDRASAAAHVRRAASISPAFSARTAAHCHAARTIRGPRVSGGAQAAGRGRSGPRPDEQRVDDPRPGLLGHPEPSHQVDQASVPSGRRNPTSRPADRGHRPDRTSSGGGLPVGRAPARPGRRGRRTGVVPGDGPEGAQHRQERHGGAASPAVSRRRRHVGEVALLPAEGSMAST